jgi:hypothetical protein
MPMSSQSENVSAEARTTTPAQEELERAWSGVTKKPNDRDSPNICERDRAQITNLARRLTDASIKSGVQVAVSNPFKGSNDPGLDPFSKEFDPKKWVETVLSLNSQSAERYLPRKAGFSFRDLSVHGFGSPISYQKNFLNVFLQVTDLVSGLINRKDQKIQILQNHNGLLRSGEMLLVLGRPGR